MIIKNEILEQCDRRQRKCFLSLRFKLCFSFLIICILTFPVRAETLSEDFDPIDLLESYLPSSLQNEEPYGLPIEKNQTTYLGDQLWQARISVSEDKKDSQNKNELQRIIKEINSVEFKPQDQTSEPLIVVESLRQAEPNEISPDMEMAQEQDTGKIEHKLLNGQVTEKTLQIFKNLSKHPNQLHNPSELADILFNSHCLAEAAKCYQEALKRTSTNEADQFGNRAWILFQIGNCLQNNDQLIAIQVYGQLITEYPTSPWVDLAKARSNLIDWYLKDKPDALINKYKLQAL